MHSHQTQISFINFFYSLLFALLTVSSLSLLVTIFHRLVYHIHHQEYHLFLVIPNLYHFLVYVLPKEVYPSPHPFFQFIFTVPVIRTSLAHCAVVLDIQQKLFFLNNHSPCLLLTGIYLSNPYLSILLPCPFSEKFFKINSSPYCTHILLDHKPSKHYVVSRSSIWQRTINDFQYVSHSHFHLPMIFTLSYLNFFYSNTFFFSTLKNTTTLLCFLPF